MVAAWQPPGAGKPEPIPPEAFGSDQIGQYPSMGVKRLHEYAVDIAGKVPLAGSELPLVRVSSARSRPADRQRGPRSAGILAMDKPAHWRIRCTFTCNRGCTR